MAVVNILDAILTDLDAVPRVLANTRDYGGRVRRVVGTVEVTDIDDNNSIYRLCRVHSSWSIHSIKTFQDTITAGTDYNLGLYETADNGGAVLSESAYGDAIDLSTADIVGTERAFNNRDIANVKQQVFEDGGLAADSDRFYDLGFIAIAVGSATGTITVVVEYTDGV